MQENRYLIPAIMLPSMALTGCSRSAKAPTSDNQPSASQNSDNPVAADNNVANQGPATPANSSANSGTQATANPTPEPLVIPAGTSITVRLQQGLSSASAVPGERFDAVVDEPIVLDNRTVIPVGTSVTGHVVMARRSGRLHHPRELGLALDSVLINAGFADRLAYRRAWRFAQEA